MGLSFSEFNFLSQAYKGRGLPRGGSILEFGECETDNLNIVAALKYLLPAGAERDELVRQAQAHDGRSDATVNFDRAKLIYRALFNYSSYSAIDLEPGADYRIQQDLNVPFDLGRQFDVCINNGTSEHVFNQANFFKAMHDHARAGGIMIHWTPCLGWHDHGLFNIQPGFFHDLARANEYEMVAGNLITASKMYKLLPLSVNTAMVRANPDLIDALACVILRKRNAAAFRFPLQGMYATLDRQQKAV